MIICVAGLRGIPRVLGGVETHCEQLFPRLKKLRSNDTFTIIARKAYVSEKVSGYKGLRIVALPHSRTKSLETITNTICAVLYARLARADLLHLHGIGPALTAPLAKALGMQVIVTYHSKNYEHEKWNVVARWALRIGEVSAILYGDRVIAVSPSLAENLRTRFPKFARKIHFVPNGADHLIGRASVKPARADDLLALHGLQKNKYIIAVGRLVPEKGLHDLIEAFKATDLDLKLVIAGDANQQDAYSRTLLAQASNRVVFVGTLIPAELHLVLQHASLFVLPSYNEGMPIAALEAAEAGAPLILSDITANLDLELPPGNYFKVGCVEDLRAKLVGDHNQFRVHREHILHRYNWEATCAETNRVYCNVLQERSEPRTRPYLAWR
jgi:glycosyltransferase involved in cell wall biosynthesis